MPNTLTQTIPGSNLGFFGNLEFKEKTVLKKYEGLLTPQECERLRKFHQDFISKLRDGGIRIPETTIHFVPKGKRFLVNIEQERFLPSELAGEIVKGGSSEEALSVAVGITSDAVSFLKSKLCGTIGFHPTIRNYAVRNGIFFMLDTFPPFSDRKSTERMMRRHAPTLTFKLIMNCFPFLLSKFTKEYYDPIEMIYGIYATMCRLRPELYSEINRAFRSIKGLDPQVQTRLTKQIEKRGYQQKSRWRVISFLKRF